MVRDGILDHFHQLDAGLSRGDAVLVKQLHHQPGEPLEGPRDPGGGVDLNQHVVGSPDVNLKQTRSVERRVKQHQQTLVGDIWPSSGEIPPAPRE